ncbi:MAG: AAA family ATPase, partial [Gemmatimonadetes bacterium]|nr:AAA family ATPase [Gemmatimonadota bacterium]
MLTRLRLENFKSWKDTGNITFKPITGFFGTNSSGKTSLFQALLLMKQTVDSSDPGIVLNFGDEKTPVDLGDFESVVHQHDTERSIGLSLGWNSEIELPLLDTIGVGTRSSGGEIGFAAEIREEDIGSGKSPILHEMAYNVRERRFGIVRIAGHKAHDLFVHGAASDHSHRVRDDDRIVRSHKFHEFRYWPPEFLKDPSVMYSLQDA